MLSDDAEVADLVGVSKKIITPDQAMAKGQAVLSARLRYHAAVEYLARRQRLEGFSPTNVNCCFQGNPLIEPNAAMFRSSEHVITNPCLTEKWA
jgi:hypothetical protein